ncbi:MAG: NAD(P)(+) transhydrogenase (Re/Si-specific) subunit beta, partial [Alphaproteobacteria bacterium]|nr:NAD(P)(+) transhydrogenase (Re/Si-specific) subunit beta [Alphaproteobacteria bacterium]
METLLTLSYLASAICFIMALRGLSGPETAQKGVVYGISGMTIAIATTLFFSTQSWGMIILGLLIGGSIGAYIAKKIEMTALPQLVAAFHSLVGLAAVFVAIAAFYGPESYGIGQAGNIHPGSLIELSLGLAIGAITFTGSIIAWGKLQGTISGKPFTFANQHLLNAILGGVLIILIFILCISESPFIFWTLLALSLLIGILLIIPIGGADMPVIVSMLNSYSG